MKIVFNSACPNPIERWMDHAAVFPNLVRMALNYLIIPGVSPPHPRARRYMRHLMILFIELATSVDAERAFSACTLVLGKLRTCLSDDTFRAGLLHSWHKATCSLISAC